MIRSRRLMVLVFALLAVMPLVAQAQELVPQPPPQPQSYSQPQLDQLTAPIALYPDPLLSQVLMASTYPLEVVEASRWRQDPNNAQLQGDQLGAALAQQPWDPSVKAVAAVPQVLTMMDQNLQWTEQLGDAFLAQQADVMDSVQRLRQMATTSGHLTSTQQQTITADEGAIAIEPANPQVVYVPVYNPTVVYGTWPYAGYNPYYFPPLAGLYITPGYIGFYAGVGIFAALWDWNRWDWHDHRILVDDRRFAAVNRGIAPRFSGDAWEHDPAHRHGVPYTSPAARQQFGAAQAADRRNFRGFDNQQSRVATPAATARSAGTRPQALVAPRTQASVQQQPRAQVQRASFQPQQQRAASPAFESFSRGTDVRAQSQRGAYSRASMPATQQRVSAPTRQAPARAAPAPRANSGGENRGGGNNRNR